MMTKIVVHLILESTLRHVIKYIISPNRAAIVHKTLLQRDLERKKFFACVYRRIMQFAYLSKNELQLAILGGKLESRNENASLIESLVEQRRSIDTYAMHPHRFHGHWAEEGKNRCIAFRISEYARQYRAHFYLNNHSLSLNALYVRMPLYTSLVATSSHITYNIRHWTDIVSKVGLRSTQMLNIICSMKV